MDSIYHEYLLDLYRHPLHKQVPGDFDVRAVETNPLCGDAVELFLKFDSCDTVVGVGWQGDGCAISQAATSVIMDKLQGKNKSFIASLTKEAILEQLGLSSLNPTRLRCALLALEGLRKAIR